MPNPGEEKLIQLYYQGKKTLQEIANQHGVSRERVRQWMEKYSLPRHTKRSSIGKRWRKFGSLDEYFDYVKNGGKEAITTLYRLILPLKKQCEKCPSTENLHIHHLKYPAMSLKDIQILCCSCHNAKHHKGNGHKIQLEICDKYIKGKNGIELAKEYKITKGMIYHILHKWNIKTRPRFGKEI